MPGARMAAEMAEQPAVLARLIARADAIAAAVRELAPQPLHGSTIVARGSSDHASVYGRYLLELASGRPVSLAAPSLHLLYDAQVDYTGQLAVAVSQSGATPEIVATLARLGAAGARTLAITNDGASALASGADGVVALAAGAELAVPATKTVTAQLLAFGLIARALGPVPFSDEELHALPAAVAAVLEDPEPARAAAALLADDTRMVVTARGLLYGAALESALKLQETAAIAADGSSSADLRHGPITIVEAGFPVLALSAGDGPAAADVAELTGLLRERGARVLTLATAAGADLPLPAVTEGLAPIVAVVRAQQLAFELALLRGRDPDAPANLSKVTAT
ncbi:SIS domain-containing protein [Conexibacter sp. JD483]|uniref:SIS domain-containing protein n=1 Tax=unclassified Conexibacter TaxID=2627773 RepID=UPI00271FF59A|nr:MULTISPECIES: SIS domain-containing protein [unclassified Conexibacter]MDO8185306.1 SIS domain-containing protein [Conexibacter sp. CPCC 205706]MDO8198352.1 SIS domain-containing protein [Conexibacter sp. CPCC 205762]MDR9370539.1 SIS domain-containing protein [Conexibacter sp. JD483]